jgi:hypothetical protein
MEVDVGLIPTFFAVTNRRMRGLLAGIRDLRFIRSNRAGLTLYSRHWPLVVLKLSGKKADDCRL